MKPVRFILRLSGMVMLPFLMGGCATVQPWIQDFNIISVAQEKQLSEQIKQQIPSEMTVLGSSPALSTVQAMGSRLVASLPEKRFDYEFFVIEENTPNAFAVPGAKIYVHTGLIKMATEAELAGVIAHEIGHAYERHPVKSMSRAYGASFISQLLLGQGEPGALKKLAIQFAGQGILTKYGRDDEREADRIAFYLLRKAGYPQDGLLSFFEKLQKLEEGSARPPVFLSTHPPTSERIENIRKLMQAPQSGVNPLAAA